MRVEILIFAGTALLMYNTYYEGNYYTKIITGWKKYMQMAAIAFMGYSLYATLKTRPAQFSSLVENVAGMSKILPLGKQTTGLLSPLIDLTTGANKFSNLVYSPNDVERPNTYLFNDKNKNREQSQFQNSRSGNAQRKTAKRSVSETKKKYVASLQDWNCNLCNSRLSAFFEIDHISPLYVSYDTGLYGDDPAGAGPNDTSNLQALCPECHRKKTAMDKMKYEK